MSARILTGGSTLTDAIICATLTAHYIEVSQPTESSSSAVAIEKDYTPHYAKKTKRSKFKRSGR